MSSHFEPSRETEAAFGPRELGFRLPGLGAGSAQFGSWLREIAGPPSRPRMELHCSAIPNGGQGLGGATCQLERPGLWFNVRTTITAHGRTLAGPQGAVQVGAAGSQAHLAPCHLPHVVGRITTQVSSGLVCGWGGGTPENKRLREWSNGEGQFLSLLKHPSFRKT